MASDRLPAMTVINLARSKDRLDGFRRRCRQPVEAIPRLNGVEGQGLDLDALEARGLLAPSARGWPRGQLGCALSHIKALLRCQRSGTPLMIFEDDALFAPDWAQRLGPLLNKAPATWDLLLLGWNMDSCLQLEWGAGLTATALFQPRHPDPATLEACLASHSHSHGQAQWFRLYKALGLAGYVVSPAGASRILSWCLPLRTLPIAAADLPERPCFSLDGQLNSLYPQLSAWVCVPPLVLGANEKPLSLTAR